MLNRALLVVTGLCMVAASCSPTLPPTTVPTQPDPTFEPFKTALQAYVDQTQPERKVAAQEAEKVPGKATADTGAEQSVRARQNSLADALRTKLRQNIEWVERETIRRALEIAGGVKKDAAELMGISQRALSYYLAKYRLES